jgi:hypothetical protein
MSSSQDFAQHVPSLKRASVGFLTSITFLTTAMVLISAL